MTRLLALILPDAPRTGLGRPRERLRTTLLLDVPARKIPARNRASSRAAATKLQRLQVGRLTRYRLPHCANAATTLLVCAQRTGVESQFPWVSAIVRLT